MVVKEVMMITVKESNYGLMKGRSFGGRRSGSSYGGGCRSDDGYDSRRF
jgi:hypothetical protein